MQVKRLGTELVKSRALNIYAVRSHSTGRIYVGRTSRELGVRFVEHRRGSGNKELSQGFDPIGDSSVMVPELDDPKQTEELIRLIEQMVIEAFGGKTQLANGRNEIAARRAPSRPGSSGRGFKGFWQAYCA